MRRLPTLRVASPCDETWTTMSPRADGRFCVRCEKTVVDLSRVTRAQAIAIVRERSGKVCGRVRANARGEVVFAPEPVRRGLVPVALAGLLAACAPEARVETTSEAAAATTDGAPPDVGLTMPTSGTFGGSLATGVMMPIGPDAPLVTPPTATPCALAEADEPVEPTAEQRALTRRKHQRHTIASYPPPPPHHTMGMMLLDD